jgi:hypothetical protein
MSGFTTDMAPSGLYLLLTFYTKDWTYFAWYLGGKFDVVKNLFIKH